MAVKLGARFSQSVDLKELRVSASAIGSKALHNFRKSRGYDSLGGCNEKLLKKLATQQGLDETCYEVAEEHLRENLVGGGIRSLWRTSAQDFGEWGVGVQLYFEFTFWFAIFSLFTGTMYMVIWILCVSGDGLGYLDDSAVGNVQVVSSKMTVANIGERILVGWNATNVTTWIRNEKTSKVFGAAWDLKNVSLAIGIVDAMCMFLVLLFLWYFEFSHIPKTVFRHREELITPDIYTVYVDRLPRRLYGGGGHESYSDRLKQHFELIMAAVVHPKTAYKGMPVIDASDRGLPLDQRPYSSVCCCCVRRAPGIDLQGRRVGNIEKVSGKSCLVKWQDTPGNPAGEQQKYKYANENLIDAKLLWKLEMNGVERVPLPKRAGVLTIGDRVQVTKESRLKGQLATVLDPYWKGKVQVEMDKEDDKGKVKSFQHGELAIIEKGKNLNVKATNSNKQMHDSAAGEWDSVIYSVGLVRDFDNQLGKMRCKAMEEDREFESKVRKQQKEGNSEKALKTFKAKYEDDDFESDLQLEDRDVVGAFITFEHIKHRDFIYSEFRFSRTPFRSFITAPHCTFADAKIRVSEAQAPSDVYWENLDFPQRMKMRRRMFVLGASTLLIVSLCLAIGLARTRAEEANSSAYKNDSCGTANEHSDCACIDAGVQNVWLDDPPGIYDQCKDWASKVAVAKVWGGLSSLVSMIAILIGGFITEPLVYLERSKSVTSVNRKIMSVTSLIYILALGIVRLLSNAKWPVNILGLFGNGRFEDLSPDWYLSVGASIIITLTINTFYPIVGGAQGPLFRLWKRFRKKKQELLTDLVALYTPPLFPFALRHAEQMSSLFALILFCGGMPILGILTPLNFWLFYAIDKYSFLRASRIPPRYTHHLISRQVQFLQFGIWCHSGFSMWVFSNADTLPSHCTQCSEDDTILGVKQGNSAIQVLVSRCFVSSALPNLVLNFIIVLSVVARITVFLLGRNPLAKSLIRRGMDHMKFDRQISVIDNDEAFHSEVRALKRQGRRHSYEIQDMPGYEFLKPAQDSKPAAKILGVALGLHGLSDGMNGVASTKDNMKNAVEKLKLDSFGDLELSMDEIAKTSDEKPKTTEKASRPWSNVEKASRLANSVRSSPAVRTFQSGDAIAPTHARNSEPAVISRPKAKVKGRGKGKRKGFAPPQLYDPEHELHLEDLARARRNLGIGATRDKPASVPPSLPSQAHSEIDEILGLNDVSSNVKAKGKGKGKGKSKLPKVQSSASAPPQAAVSPRQNSSPRASRRQAQLEKQPLRNSISDDIF